MALANRNNTANNYPYKKAGVSIRLTSPVRGVFYHRNGQFVNVLLSIFGITFIARAKRTTGRDNS